MCHINPTSIYPAPVQKTISSSRAQPGQRGPPCYPEEPRPMGDPGLGSQEPLPHMAPPVATAAQWEFMQTQARPLTYQQPQGSCISLPSPGELSLYLHAIYSLHLFIHTYMYHVYIQFTFIHSHIYLSCLYTFSRLFYPKAVSFIHFSLAYELQTPELGVVSTLFN